MDGEPPTSSKRIRVNKSAVHKEFKDISWKCPKTKKNLEWNSKAEPSAICQYVCLSFLFVQPISS